MKSVINVINACCSYLAEAVLNLDPKDTVVSQHMGRILGMVRQKLADYMTNYPASLHRRVIASIEKSIRSMLKYTSN